MDDPDTFEHRLAISLDRLAGQRRQVDAMAIARSASTPASTWRTRSMLGATRFAAMAVVVAVLGGFLFVTRSLVPEEPSAPGAASDASAQPPEADCGPLADNRPTDLVAGCGYGADLVGFQVPTSGWAYRPYGSLGLRLIGVWSIAKGDAAALDAGALPSAEILFSRSTPDGAYTDPCGQVRGRPLHVPTDDGQAILQHSADLVAAMAEIPGIEVVEGPSEVTEPDGYRDTRGDLPANHLIVRVPADACMPFDLWWDTDMGARQVTEPGDTIRFWIYNHPYIRGLGIPLRMWIEAETRADAGPGLDREILQIIDSIETPG